MSSFEIDKRILDKLNKTCFKGLRERDGGMNNPELKAILKKFFKHRASDITSAKRKDLEKICQQELTKREKRIKTKKISVPKFFIGDRPLEEYINYDKPKVDGYILSHPNTRDFYDYIPDLNKKKVDYNLLPHQNLVANYIDPATPYRGVLVYHGVGLGKTRTAIESADRFINKDKRILLLIPASLRKIWEDQIVSWSRQPDPLSHYDILHYNDRSGSELNVYTKIESLYDDDKNALFQYLIIIDESHNLINSMTDYNSKLGLDIYNSLMQTIDCKVMMLSATPIINKPFELAIMFNIIKGSVIFTGEEELFNEKYLHNIPILKNRLAGLISYYASSEKDDNKLLPDIIYKSGSKTDAIEVEMSEYQTDVYMHIRQDEIDREQGSKKFGSHTPSIHLDPKVAKQKRRMGIAVQQSSSETYKQASRQACNFVYPNTIQKFKKATYISSSDVIRMLQFASDNVLEIFEVNEIITKKEINKLIKKVNVSDLNFFLQKLKKKISIDSIENNKEKYFIRKLINSTEVISKKDFKNRKDAHISKLNNKKKKFLNINTLPKYSNKMATIYNNIMNSDGSEGKIMVYSFYVTGEGLKIFSLILEANGFVNYKSPLELSPNFKNKSPPKSPNEVEGNISGGNISGGNISGGIKTYIMYTGSESLEERRKLMKAFNASDNIHGEKIKIFLGSAAAAEGISLFGIRQLHIMEPHWHEVRIEQVIGRTSRIKSHMHLPKSERNVYVYRYNSVMSDVKNRKFEESLTSDQMIFEKAKKKQEINNRMLDVFKSVSIDCTSHDVIKGIKCSEWSNKVALFDENIMQTIEINNNKYRVEPHRYKIKLGNKYTFADGCALYESERNELFCVAVKAKKGFRCVKAHSVELLEDSPSANLCPAFLEDFNNTGKISVV